MFTNLAIERGHPRNDEVLMVQNGERIMAVGRCKNESNESMDMR